MGARNEGFIEPQKLPPVNLIHAKTVAHHREL